mmetsp:Transcript_13386/g.19716  ORF Transcript_13386/g.19716 Transcript_13386/m.19716 type:complete len:185 (+) Transcript_13386:364-918(+)
MSFRLIASSWCKAKPSKLKLALEKFLSQREGNSVCSKQQIFYSTERTYNGMMRTPQKVLTLKAADAIANHAIDAVKTLINPTPVVVTVLDSSGSVLVQKRMVRIRVLMGTFPSTIYLPNYAATHAHFPCFSQRMDALEKRIQTLVTQRRAHALICKLHLDNLEKSTQKLEKHQDSHKLGPWCLQ